jgi:hypothetical protein
MTNAELEESVKRYSLSTNDVSRDIIQEIHPASRLIRSHKKALDTGSVGVVTQNK